MAALFRRADRSKREQSLRLEAERGRRLVEASPEVVLVLDEEQRVVAASARARRELGVREGSRGDAIATAASIRIPYDVDGRRELLVYVTDPGGPPYEELRAAFTAAVSHELRTPVARLLALLETAQLPGAQVAELIEQARLQVEEIRELVDEVLFLSELETGREVVALGTTRARPILDAVAARLAEHAHRADVTLRVAADPELELPLRPRMLRVVVDNLATNSIRYAGLGATCTLAVERVDGSVVLRVTDDGAGVDEEDLPRLFERFYRADRVRASRGTGLGLAIVKHIVTAAGGTVEATGGSNRGLEIRCRFPE